MTLATMELVTVVEKDAKERGRVDLASRHMRGVAHLLAHRDDLRGVYAFADIVEESVRWSA